MYLIHSEHYEAGEMISQELVHTALSHSEGVRWMVDHAEDYPHPEDNCGSTLYMLHPEDE